MSPLSQVKKPLISLRFLFNSEKGSRCLKTSSELILSSSATLGFIHSFSSPKHFTHIKAVNPCEALASHGHYSHPLRPKGIRGLFSSRMSCRLTQCWSHLQPQMSHAVVPPVDKLPLTSLFMAPSLPSPPHQKKDLLPRYFIYSLGTNARGKLHCTSDKSALAKVMVLV